MNTICVLYTHTYHNQFLSNCVAQLFNFFVVQKPRNHKHAIAKKHDYNHGLQSVQPTKNQLAGLIHFFVALSGLSSHKKKKTITKFILIIYVASAYLKTIPNWMCHSLSSFGRSNCKTKIVVQLDMTPQNQTKQPKIHLSWARPVSTQAKSNPTQTKVIIKCEERVIRKIGNLRANTNTI